MRNIYKHKLTIWAVSVSLMFILFLEMDGKAQGILDPYLVLFIGAVKQIIVIMMILFTRQWSWRAIGVMSVMQGVAVLYLGSAILYWNPDHVGDWGEPVTDLGRAFFFIGIFPLFIGVVSYGWVVTSFGLQRRNTTVADGDTWDIPAIESKGQRDKRQDVREDELDTRARGLDKRGWDMSKESLNQEQRRSVLEDREDALAQREKE